MNEQPERPKTPWVKILTWTAITVLAVSTVGFGAALANANSTNSSTVEALQTELSDSAQALSEAELVIEEFEKRQDELDAQQSKLDDKATALAAREAELDRAEEQTPPDEDIALLSLIATLEASPDREQLCQGFDDLGAEITTGAVNAGVSPGNEYSVDTVRQAFDAVCA